MSLIYADTSAVVRAYFVDEDDHLELRSLLFDRTNVVVTSELTRVELASAVHSVRREGRLADAATILDRFDADCQADGALTLLRLRPDEDLVAARALLGEHPLRTLAAIHLAVAVHVARPLAAGDAFALATRDVRQQAAAPALGLALR
ncbi:type II toxin-antitoxin system VapC family toxin [soil metagenome]